ncbi:MAG: PAS domain-containing protein [Myxococcaceae bacterium]|nr:PAS domain-containing protein [Myxococcaceae bacterium]
MRVSLLVSTDGAVAAVTDTATALEPRLVAGVNLADVPELQPLARAVQAARQGATEPGTCAFAGQTWDLEVSMTPTGAFVTLEALQGDFELAEVLTSGRPLSEVLDALARLSERRLPGYLASVLLLGDDGLLRPGAGSSLPVTLRAASNGLAPGPECGACGSAVWSRGPVLVADMRGDRRFLAFAEVLEPLDLHACWSFPILSRAGNALGTLSVYGPRPALPTAAQAAFLQSMARFASLAVEQWGHERSRHEILERFHLAAEASTNVIYDWNVRADVLEWSPRLEPVFGYDMATPRNLAWWESCIHPAERVQVTSSLNLALAERRKTWVGTYRFLKKDGSWATVIDHGRLLFDDEGAPVRLIGEMQDISGQQQLQARLTLTERLASVGTLAAGVAHEINNPLAWISSNLHFALEELGKLRAETGLTALDEVAEALNDARTGAERVSTIVRDLKLFSRAQDEQTGIVDVRRVLESAITMARNEIRHRAQLERRLDEVPLVKGNEGKLSQVFLNLLINAAHAVPEGDVGRNAIVVSTTVDANGCVVVAVQDTGQGIEPDVLPHIFDPFFTTKPVGQGTGLGLSICHSIITSLGGSISVDSTPGRGSTFKVTLPAAPPEFRKSPLPQPKPPLAPRGRIALIDDEPAVLVALQRLLGPHHEVKSFSRPLQALDELPAFAPDVVFCDVMMPEMSGAELFRRLRAAHPRLAERVVFMTGGAFSATAREFLDDVERPMLEKPFTAEGVRRLANEQVAKARAQA